LLAGKYKSGALPSGSRLQLHERYRRNYLTQDNLAAVAACEHNAGRLGVSLVEYAYWWCLTRPAVASVLTSFSSVAQLAPILRAVARAEKDPDPDEALHAAPDIQARHADGRKNKESRARGLAAADK
jgi:aryl-alcohol dehydrogenase-like predicted oxidoreductase